MSEHRLRRYLRKADVLVRYGWRSKISIDRATKAGRLPQPDIYLNKAPLWLETSLDRHDAKMRRRHAAGA
jgi:hypothetical protein